ncbi:16S rRNA (cytosine(1402)-N(4))-methyltransferase RsmH [Eisenibacter elegans]|jgi:16S rRNA (cytosine1402-N4)-methyltransferase|uniref:16S rRNA (cytosine(1402)-N(4))-methyltransferase RsmH n=1 Tax=Eisenibacter elegans TaxID=997 RepID=UPI00047EB6EA|nr:16S rRNA (cytosine(1402)-N(4))-methyltransferase RsmH [Eisenibacter elegans]
MSETYHIPVLRDACLEGLNIRPDGTYVDVTFGGGGHSKALLERLDNKGRLYAFDQDAAAAEQAQKLATYPQFQFIQANFRYIGKFLRLHGVRQVDGILADLGVSSHQFDTAERGFSIRADAPLDMRMDTAAPLTAAEVLRTYSEAELHRILGMYGEVRNAKTLANALVRARQQAPIATVAQLKAVLEKHAPKHREFKYFAQVFQALRIVVNEEMGVLEEFLGQCASLIRPGGRLVVLSYHSLEDRPVKNLIQKGVLFGEPEKDVYGNFYKPFEALHRKPIEADETELAANPRARSAKLRVAVRTEDGVR